MIDKDSLGELKIMSDMLSSGTAITATNKKAIYSIFHDAMDEAISSVDSEENILFILQRYPLLTQLLLEVVAEKYPAHLDRLNKLIVLT